MDKIYFNYILGSSSLGVIDLKGHRPGDLQSLAEIAAIAENGGIDALIFGHANNAATVRKGRPFFPYEPFTAAGALAAITERIGLAVAVNTLTSQPNNVARRIATLDHIGKGRMGWHVALSDDREQEQYRELHLPQIEQSARRDAEFIDVVHELWDSWSPDAIVEKPDGGLRIDGGGNRPINHAGDFFSVKGPMTVPRTPQGKPVLFQSVHNESDRDMAARYADVVIPSGRSMDDVQQFSADFAHRLKAHGRTRRDVRIMPVIRPSVVMEEERPQDSAHGEFAGTPQAIAERIRYWRDRGVVDGFTLAGTSLKPFTEHVMPCLRQAGGKNDGASRQSLRDLLGMRNIYRERLASK